MDVYGTTQPFPQHSSTTSSSLPSLHSQALKPFANGLGDVSMAVMANPAKIQETIHELSDNERNPHIYGQGAGQKKDVGMDVDENDGDDILEQERMHMSDVSRTADDILMGKMEQAGYYNNAPEQQQQQQPQRDDIDDRFFNIPQNDMLLADDFGDEGGRETGEQHFLPEDSFHNRFTAPKSELDASGVHTDEIMSDAEANDYAAPAKTQSVRMNLDNNVVNTFDNSVYATQAPDHISNYKSHATSYDDNDNDRDDGVGRRRADADERSASSRSGGGVDSESRAKSATESDATAYELEKRQRDRRRRKKEKRRRERLPHERTYGEWQEERHEDWERQIQQNVKEAEDTEKRELLLLFAEKEQEGHKMLRSFNMSSNLNEMRFWYYKLLRDERTDDEVAHLRSHLVEGTRMLLFLNENVFDNPLGLADMTDFADSLSSMLVGSWDRHIRDYVKSKNGLQGPPPQPLRNLGLNFLHLFISHHRKKASEEQKEKKQREAAQREALFAAAQQRHATGGVATNPFEAIFGERTSHLRGGQGINPMEMPPYANASTVPAGADPSYAEYLAFKQRNTPEYREFLDYQRSKKNPTISQQWAPPPPLSSSHRQQQQQQRQKPQSVPRAFLDDNVTSRMQMSASPVPNDMQPPQVASIDIGHSSSSRSDFRQPASPHSRVRATTATQSNSWLAGANPLTATTTNSNQTKNDNSGIRSGTNSNTARQLSTQQSKSKSRSDTEDSLMLSTSARSISDSSTSTTEADSSGAFDASRRNQAPGPAPPAMPPQLPLAYRSQSQGAKLLQNLGKRGGLVDERAVPIPPAPDVSRSTIKKLQDRLSRAKERADSRLMFPIAPNDSPLKQLRATDREKVQQLLERSSLDTKKQISNNSNNKNNNSGNSSNVNAEANRARVSDRKVAFRTDDAPYDANSGSSSGNSSSSATEVTSSDASNDGNNCVPQRAEQNNGGADDDDYSSLLAQLEAECDALDEDEEDVAAYDDVQNVPDNATQMENQKKDNRILEMLSMFQNFMSSNPKGQRPAAQSSMFSDIDSLFAAGDDDRSSSSATLSNSHNNGGNRSSQKRRRRRRGARVTSSQSSSSSPNQSSSASFHLDGETSLGDAGKMLDSNGRFTF